MNTNSSSARDWSGLEIIDDEECMQLLRGSAVGRVGFVDHGEPVILPVNFAMDGRSIVFQTGHGSKLSSALMEQPICIEVDGFDGLGHTGWSVLAKGVAHTVDDDDHTRHLASLPVRPWSSPELRQRWVRIVVDEISGRRIVPIEPPATDELG